MDLSQLEELQEIYVQSTTWVNPPVLLDGYQSAASSHMQQFDVVATIGTKVGKGRRSHSDERIYLPAQFNSCEATFRRGQLYTYISKAFANAGVEVRCRRFEQNTANLVCRRSRFYEDRGISDTKGTTKRQTSRPVAGESTRCSFHFNVYWSPAEQRWFFYKNGAGSRNHCGHGLKQTQHVVQPSRNIGAEATNLANDLIATGVNLQSVADFIQQRTGQRLTQDMLKGMRKTIKETLIVSRAVPGTVNEPSSLSAADRLLNYFESDPDIEYCALFADYDTPLLQTPKIVARSKRKRSLGVESECPTRGGDVNTEASVDNVWLGDGEESPVTVGVKIRNALKVTTDSQDTPKILLCVAWTTTMMQRRFEMFPDVVGVDITTKVNNEKRPLCLAVGSDCNNQNFTFLSAFFPSQAGWVFDWYFAVVMPKLFSQRALRNVNILLTDEDSRCIRSFQKYSVAGSIFSSAILRLCAWHKINRGLRKCLSARLEKLR